MNTGLSEEKKDYIKNKQKRFFWIIATITVSVIILYVLIQVLFYNSNVNQGKFRLIDIAVVNTASLEDTSQQTKDWTFDIIQSNLLTLLIHASDGAKVQRAYISDISCTGVCTDVSIYSKGETPTNVENIDLNTQMYDDSTIIYEIGIDNRMLKNFAIPDGVTKIEHNGTIFKLANLTIKDITYSVKFKINIVESNSRINTLEVELKLPNEALIQQGSSIERLEYTDFVFRTKLF